jgi:polyisoprenoid-binding protein YceI
MFIFSILIALIYSHPSFSGPWITNKDHSEIMFEVPYMGVSELTGRFNEFSGSVEYKDDGSIESLIVKIPTASVDTGNKMRDGHLKGNDFFKSNVHPYMTFKSTNVVKVKEDLFKASGILTIKNISKPHTVEFSVTKSMKDTWGYENKFAKFKSSINRKDYLITWNKTLDGKELLVGDEIGIRGTFQLQPVTDKTPNSKHMIPDTDYIRERDLKRRKEESSFSRSFRKLINSEE